MGEATAGERLLDEITKRAASRARARVEALRRAHPLESKRQLGERLVRSFARKAGLGGAASGVVALVSLPVGLPAGVALTLALEAELLLSLLTLYEVELAGDGGRLKLYALWAGSGLADAAKSVGLKMSAEALGGILAGSLPARLVARLHPALVRFVLRRVGLGWLPRALKLWPLVGAPIGYVLDSGAVKTLGTQAIDALEEMPRAPEPIVIEVG